MKGTRSYPVGSGTYSKHPDRYPEGAPRIVTWAEGAWVGDDLRFADGLVDLTSSMGAVILGHDYPAVTDAILHQLGEGIAFPLPTHLEQQVADRLLSLLTWKKAESVRFGKNGADVTTSAVRLARAVTGRPRVLYCDYAGHHDWSMQSPPWNGGVAVEELLSQKVDREDLLREVCTRVNLHHPAAVVLEVYPSAPGDHAAVDWAELRRACSEVGTLLILDEMVTGFRCAPGGAAELSGIEPDLACYGKAMANGMPLSAVVGPYDILKRYEEDVFFSLTHAGEALSLAAANATMRVVKEQNVPSALASLGYEIYKVFEEHGASHRVRLGYPQRLLFDFTRDELGILLQNGVLCSGFANLTLAHCEDAEARRTILDAFRAVLSA